MQFDAEIHGVKQRGDTRTSYEYTTYSDLKSNILSGNSDLNYRNPCPKINDKEHEAVNNLHPPRVIIIKAKLLLN